MKDKEKEIQGIHPADKLPEPPELALTLASFLPLVSCAKHEDLCCANPSNEGFSQPLYKPHSKLRLLGRHHRAKAPDF